MAQPTARELIVDAYRSSGVRGRLSDPGATETAIGLSLLNRDIIDLVRNNRLFNVYVKSYEVTTTGASDYSIGVAGATTPDIVTNQDIVRILNAQVKIGNTWSPIQQISAADEFRTSTTEGSSAVPGSFVYNRTGDPFDTISFIQSPLSGYKVRFSVNGGVVNYGLDDEIALPGGYYSYLKYALAELICLGAGLDETEAKMRRKAAECLDRLELVNAEQAPLLSTGGRGGLYNIFTERIGY